MEPRVHAEHTHIRRDAKRVCRHCERDWAALCICVRRSTSAPGVDLEASALAVGQYRFAVGRVESDDPFAVILEGWFVATGLCPIAGALGNRDHVVVVGEAPVNLAGLMIGRSGPPCSRCRGSAASGSRLSGSGSSRIAGAHRVS